MMKVPIRSLLPLLLTISDTFTVTLTPDDNLKNRITIENVYLDNLISVIDENVEYCENYETKVRQWLRKQAV